MKQNSVLVAHLIGVKHETTSSGPTYMSSMTWEGSEIREYRDMEPIEIPEHEGGYLLFAWEDYYYPTAGAQALVGVFPSCRAAMDALPENSAGAHIAVIENGTARIIMEHFYAWSWTLSEAQRSIKP